LAQFRLNLGNQDRITAALLSPGAVGNFGLAFRVDTVIPREAVFVQLNTGRRGTRGQRDRTKRRRSRGSIRRGRRGNGKGPHNYGGGTDQRGGEDTSESSGWRHLELTNIGKAESGGRRSIYGTESGLRHGRLMIVPEGIQLIDLGHKRHRGGRVVDFSDDRGFVRHAPTQASASAREVENKVGHGLALGAVEVRGVTADLHHDWKSPLS
jgi:hypothetical protein